MPTRWGVDPWRDNICQTGAVIAASERGGKGAERGGWGRVRAEGEGKEGGLVGATRYN